MDQRTRMLMLRVCDDHPRVPWFMMDLRNHPKAAEFLSYLIASRLTGKAFIEWIEFRYGGDTKRALEAWLQSNSSPAVRPLILSS